jgi:Uri superfamily endonuclease
MPNLGLTGDLPQSGLYQLWIYVRCPIWRHIGSLGRVRLAPGWYVYTGSAKRNLPARIARHRRRKKKLHWHIDYLLTCPHATIREVHTRRWQNGGECTWHAQTMRREKATNAIPRFGSSDCRCPGHLLFIGPRCK